MYIKEQWNYPTRLTFHNEVVYNAVPRIFSQLNRCPVSGSSGSFDREYWAWSTKDFANQDLQRAVGLLARLYSHKSNANSFYQNTAVLVWFKWAVSFWINGQDKGGGFDHLYPREKSWMAAAFTLVDFIYAWDLVSDAVEPALRSLWLNSMEKAGSCLIQRDETHGFISNHRNGAAAGLLALYRITQKRQYLERAFDLLTGILRYQSSDGFFLEYEGADPGYETLGLHYLAKVHKELLNLYETDFANRIANAVQKSLTFLSYFVHPDGSLGGEYGSRACPHFFPGGLEYWAGFFPEAEAICCFVTPSLKTYRSSGLQDADERNFIPLLSSTLFAIDVLENRSNMPETAYELPHKRSFERYFPKAGIYVRSCQPDYYCIVGVNKGGVIKIYGPNDLLYSDCGYTAKSAFNKAVTTLKWHLPRYTELPYSDMETPVQKDTRVSFYTDFLNFAPNREMRTIGMVIFRLFNMTFGRIQVFNDIVRKTIIKLFLYAGKKTRIFLKRCVIFEDSQIIVEDRFENTSLIKFGTLWQHGFFSTIYMASARYFRMGDLRQVWSKNVTKEDMSQGISAIVIIGGGAWLFPGINSRCTESLVNFAGGCAA